MTQRQHKFITIEGLKGSGKTSVSRALAEQLGALWYTTPPEPFRAIRDVVEQKATPHARYLYYLAGIVQASAEIETILSHQPVVCDKFLATMVAYSRAAGIEVSIPPSSLVIEPDFSFLLVVPDDVRRQRIASRGVITAAEDAFFRMEVEQHVMDGYHNLKVHVLANCESGLAATVTHIRAAVES
ncbi:MAG: AAA family ATPase [Acidobacteria bacterium]|nr:AAA family ATPase [Acidobacteriota bacterium]